MVPFASLDGLLLEAYSRGIKSKYNDYESDWLDKDCLAGCTVDVCLQPHDPTWEKEISR
jgi:hypothetical protein